MRQLPIIQTNQRQTDWSSDLIQQPHPLLMLVSRNLRLITTRPGKPAVILSPSQIGTYDRCKRKWAWENIAGFRSPPTKSQILGTRVHSVFEAWLQHGTPPDRRTLEGRIALQGISNIPAPGIGIVEKQFYLSTVRGLHFTGIVDLLYWQYYVGAVVTDHKTTSHMKWAKTKEELEYDVQALLYAVFACIAFQTDRVTLRWNYVQTDGKNAKLVETLLHLSQIIERFPIVENLALEMTFHRVSQTHPLRILPNPNACGEFGGCPHADRCNLSTLERFEAMIMTEANGTMRENMHAMQAYTNGGQAQPGQQIQPVQNYLPTTPPAPQQYAGQPGWTQEQLAQYHAQQPQQHPPQQQTYPQAGAIQGYVPSQQPPQQQLHQPTLQPMQPQYQQQPQQQAVPQQQYPNYSPTSGPNPPEQSAQGEIPAPIATPQLNVNIAPSADETKKGRGRPSGAKNKESAGEELAFAHAIAGFMANPNLNLTTVSVEQLAYVGNLARAAHQKTFGA